MTGKTVWVIVGIVIVLLILFIIYQRYKFPHAKVINQNALSGVTWSNGDTTATIRPGCSGQTGGTYSRKYDWMVECLPNNQFRFIIHERGNKQAIIVDNIFIFNNVKEYLTK